MLNRPFIIIWISMLVAMIGISMVSPLLPVLVQDELGGPPLAVALAFSSMAIPQIIGAPFIGRAGDRFGPKRFIVIGFALYGLGSLGYLISTNWQTVIGFRMLCGVGAAAVFPMALTYVGRLAPVGAEGRYMGWFGVAQTGGFGIGPLFGGGLRDAFGLRAAFSAMALLMGGTALLASLGLPSERRLRRAPQDEVALLAAGDDAQPAAPAEMPTIPYRILLRRPAVVGATLLVLLLGASWGSASAWLAIFVIDHEGLATNSALFAGVLLSSRQLTSAVLAPITGPLADRTNRVALVGLGLIVSGIAQVSIPLVPRTLVDTSIFGAAMTMAPWVLGVLLIAGIAESLATPAQQALFVQLGRTGGMGSLMGLNAMGNSVGFLSGSLVGAWVKSTFGLGAVFTFAGAVTMGGAVIFLLLMSRDRGEPEPAVTPSLA